MLAGLPDPEDRAYRIRRFLRQLFEKTYGFTLEPLTKKPLKESVKALQEYEAFASDYVLATVIQQALGRPRDPRRRPDPPRPRAAGRRRRRRPTSPPSAPSSNAPSPRTAASSSST